MKNKQIEEMARIIEHACDDCDGNIDDCLKCPHKCHEYYGCGQEKTATALYNAGYRKLPKDSKETAENILNSVFKYLIENSHPYLDDEFYVLGSTLDECYFKLCELAKQFGAEIKE